MPVLTQDDKTQVANANIQYSTRSHAAACRRSGLSIRRIDTALQAGL